MVFSQCSPPNKFSVKACQWVPFKGNPSLHQLAIPASSKLQEAINHSINVNRNKSTRNFAIPPLIKTNIGQQNLVILLDNGADLNLISLATIHRLGLQNEMKRIDTLYKQTISFQTINNETQVKYFLDLQFQGISSEIRLHVVESLGDVSYFLPQKLGTQFPPDIAYYPFQYGRGTSVLIDVIISQAETMSCLDLSNVANDIVVSKTKAAFAIKTHFTFHDVSQYWVHGAQYIKDSSAMISNVSCNCRKHKFKTLSARRALETPLASNICSNITSEQRC